MFISHTKSPTSKIYDSLVSRFPEDLYPSYSSEYFDRVISGYEIMKKSSVFVCGIMRNIECNVKRLCARIRKIESLFNEFDYYFYENDSTDDTVRLFSQHFNLESETLMTGKYYDKSSERRELMANARNKYLSKAQHSKADYTIVIDTDVLGGYSYDGIANSISYQRDVMTSNGLYYSPHRVYYDSWAYRKFNNESDLGDLPNLLVFNRGEQPVEVFSGFGGMAIYNQCIHNAGHYTSDDCDHVTLHKQLRNAGYKIWLNPSQLVLYNETQYGIIK